MFFGQAMMPGTTVHRVVPFTGPPRSGKSTSKNVLEQLVGRAHIAQTQLSDLGKEFGLQDAINKRLIVIPDANRSFQLASLGYFRETYALTLRRREMRCFFLENSGNIAFQRTAEPSGAAWEPSQRS